MKYIYPQTCSLLILLTLLVVGQTTGYAASVEEHVKYLSQFPDRTSGSAGAYQSADYIEQQFKKLGLETKRQSFKVPVKKHGFSFIEIEGKKHQLSQFDYNIITPGATKGVLEGPLYYVANGDLDSLDGKKINGAIILMEFDSGRNWLRLASLGAQGLIYIDHGDTGAKQFFEQKLELSPIQFPCFWMTAQEAEKFFPVISKTDNGLVAKQAKLSSQVHWAEISTDNLFTVIQGSDTKLAEELVILEAFYDSASYIPGAAPGADEAISIATLLATAEELTQNPPKRSVMLLATSGHDQTLAGMREIIWSIRTNTKYLKRHQKKIGGEIKRSKLEKAVLHKLSFPLTPDSERDGVIETAISNSLRLAIDNLSSTLMHLRMEDAASKENDTIKQLANKRFTYRRLGWAEDYHSLPDEETEILQAIIPSAIKELEGKIASSAQQLTNLESSMSFRRTVRQYDIAAILSLHLSSHGNGVGGFHKGWLYNLKAERTRTGIYNTINSVFEQAAKTTNFGRANYIDSLRPDRTKSWDSWFPDRPFMGGEVSSLAGYIGVTLATTGDARSLWGTPWDIPEKIDWEWVADQTLLIKALIQESTNTEKLHDNLFPRMGFSTATGRANLLLQGELFANYPAEKTVLLAYQGGAKYHSMVDSNGNFIFKGIADKKNVLDKLIIEGYRFDDLTGEVKWAIDKKTTGKSRYRLKMIRNNMETELIMFKAKETTIFDLLEPRNLNYMTKIKLYDGKRDTTPQHYWYSRIDTRNSTISSIYTSPGTHLKLTLSDTLLTNKFILSNGTKEHPMGSGYSVDDHPAIINTVYHAAKDAWTLITPRIENLENHGIYDDKISLLKNRGLLSLANSETALNSYNYSHFKEAAAESLALATRVYSQIEKTQKDVLFGVLFYVALFIPFAFCMERFLFNFSNIYKRIGAFTAILATLIAVIYKVHPAFKLAYSPMVIILAFFIIGLSFMVSLIIFFRFEEEMVLLQRRATHKRPAEISHWKAFVAAFFLGVSNLRRRKMRTLLTCATLVILTFTIMSFTTIKSNQSQNRMFFQDHAPYQGLLLKKVNWQSLPGQATDILTSSMRAISTPAPRIWLDPLDPTHTVRVPIRNNNNEYELHGLIGLSPEEDAVTGLGKILSSGRWFVHGERTVIIIEDSMAKALEVTVGDNVDIWGTNFTVIGTFPGDSFDKAVDLDGEPLTPVTFPDESTGQLSEVEQEAMESGDDVRSFQSRYQHVAASETAIIPSSSLLAMGGSLKNVAVKIDNAEKIDEIASTLTDRFSLAIFAGDKDGVWLYNLSDTLQYAGIPNVIIPLLLSTLIVLNTMISSVYERKSEIAVYTSVGLAPSHVSFLFVAEALALAIISVVTGYLVAQVSASFLAETSLWEGITVNYSSMAGVAAMILVIGVVLISVIYPSRVAAKIAIPDVNRSFSLPKPVDDKITVTLPFYMKYDESDSIGGFINDYLVGHQDVSHGIFSIGPVELISISATEATPPKALENKQRLEACSHHLRAKMWLAPFDFGIMQQVDIQFCPAPGEEDFLEIKLTIQRFSGEAGIWQHLNTRFLHAIRKQLLVWRSIDDEAHNVLKGKFLKLIQASSQETS